MEMRLNNIFFTFSFPFSVLMKQQKKLPNFDLLTCKRFLFFNVLECRGFIACNSRREANEQTESNRK